jgi:hypothetical protein
MANTKYVVSFLSPAADERVTGRLAAFDEYPGFVAFAGGADDDAGIIAIFKAENVTSVRVAQGT